MPQFLNVQSGCEARYTSKGFGAIPMVVYLITNTVNGKFYVGKTIHTLSRRWSQHKRASARGSRSYLHKAMRSYGADSFTIEPLWENITTETELSEWEIEFIYLLQTNNHSYGYNLTSGGEGSSCITTSALQKKKASELGKIMGKLSVDSGRLARCRTPGHQSEVGKRGGSVKTEAKTRNCKAIAHLGGAAAAASGQAASIAHIRWHIKRGIVKEGCPLCK